MKRLDFRYIHLWIRARNLQNPAQRITFTYRLHYLIPNHRPEPTGRDTLMLSRQFDALLDAIGNPELARPVFYSSPIGIRFELGSDTPIYGKNQNLAELEPDPEYLAGALTRAQTIYHNLPHPPNILRIDVVTLAKADINKADTDAIAPAIDVLLRDVVGTPAEQRAVTFIDEDDGETLIRHELYWTLPADFSAELLLHYIITADLGGPWPANVPVFFANTEDEYLYFVYDDRGADLIATIVETIRPAYERFNDWILDYDRERIDRTFTSD